MTSTTSTSMTGLTTYLNDHLAGATAGSELAAKISSEGGVFESGLSFFAELVREINQDKATLEDIMRRLGIEKAPMKQLVGWAGEKLSRAKLSESATGDRDLKRLLEFEVLSLGIEGKLLMWRTLAEVCKSHTELATELAEVDLAALAASAESQRANLEEQRLKMATQALTG